MVLPTPTVYPFINIDTNKVEYLTEDQAALRNDLRTIKPGEVILPEQMPDASGQPGPPSFGT